MLYLSKPMPLRIATFDYHPFPNMQLKPVKCHFLLIRRSADYGQKTKVVLPVELSEVVPLDQLRFQLVQPI